MSLRREKQRRLTDGEKSDPATNNKKTKINKREAEKRQKREPTSRNHTRVDEEKTTTKEGRVAKVTSPTENETTRKGSRTEHDTRKN